MKKIFSVSLILALGGLVWVFWKDQGVSDQSQTRVVEADRMDQASGELAPTPTPPSPPSSRISEVVAPSVLVREIALLATNWYFDPEEIRVKQGERIRLTVTGAGRDHGFSLQAFDIALTVAPGETKTVEFVAEKTGMFPFECSVYCGDGHTSMQGVLIVEE